MTKIADMICSVTHSKLLKINGCYDHDIYSFIMLRANFESLTKGNDLNKIWSNWYDL